MADRLDLRGLRGLAGSLSANAGKMSDAILYDGPNSTPQTPQTPQISGSDPVTVESILHLLEDGLDFALSLGDAEAAVEAIMGMAAIQGLAADRVEVIAAVDAELRKLEE